MRYSTAEFAYKSGPFLFPLLIDLVIMQIMSVLKQGEYSYEEVFKKKEH